ncbi:restriction endonuclease subunit S [Vibrio plantisponsor]|uniref:restriction endonuclease subunit S n=1 Tax=Vibrio plantisponsor TaxID=664643 RepID=UPI00370AAFB0
MSCNWPVVRLGDYIDSCLGKMLDKKKNKGTPHTYLGNSNVRWGTFDLNDLAEMKFEDSEHVKYGLKNGDLVVCEGGEPGRCAIWEGEDEMRIQKALHRIRPNQYLDNYYLYYWFLHSARTGTLEPYFTGTTIKHLTGKALAELPIQLPPLVVQKEMAQLLQSLDRKINHNTQTNQTLEEMAQAIFKSWFVDFDPVKAKMNGEQPEGMDAATASLFPDKLVESEFGLIPEGWEVKPLDKIAHFENGLALQKFRPESEEDDFLPVLKIAQLRQGYCDGKEKARTDIKESCRVYDGDMIFSWSGSLMIDLWTGGKAALNQHLFKVTSKNYNLPLYLFWTKHHLAKFQQIAKDKAVTMGHIKRGHLSESLCVIPPKELRDKLDDVLLPLINQGLNLRLQNNQLASLRDTLLPKLLSGEIELGETEEMGEVS